MERAGPQGIQGEQGPVGLVGPQGPQGPQGLVGYEIVRANIPSNFNAGATSGSISCPAGKKVLGGGGVSGWPAALGATTVINNDATLVLTFQPTNTSGGTGAIVAWVACAYAN